MDLRISGGSRELKTKPFFSSLIRDRFKLISQQSFHIEKSESEKSSYSSGSSQREESKIEFELQTKRSSLVPIEFDFDPQMTGFQIISLDEYKFLLAALLGNSVAFYFLSLFDDSQDRIGLLKAKDKKMEIRIADLEEKLTCADFGYVMQEESNEGKRKSSLVLAVAGKLGKIYLIDVSRNDKFKQPKILEGHFNDIHTVLFAKENKTFTCRNIMLSGSLEGYSILWNAFLGVKVATFREKGLNTCEISIKWNITHDFFVVLNRSTRVTIWEIDEKLRKNIEKVDGMTETPEQERGKVCTYDYIVPVFSSYDALTKMPDAIEFFGSTLLIKDIDGNLKLFVPILESEKKTIFLLKDVCFKDVNLGPFIRSSPFMHRFYLGTQCGKIIGIQLNSEKEMINISDIWTSRRDSQIEEIIICDETDILFARNSNGTILIQFLVEK